MKILLYDWNQKSTYINKQDIHDMFRQMGIEFDSFLFDFGKQNISELEEFFCGYFHNFIRFLLFYQLFPRTL